MVLFLLLLLRLCDYQLRLRVISESLFLYLRPCLKTSECGIRPHSYIDTEAFRWQCVWSGPTTVQLRVPVAVSSASFVWHAVSVRLYCFRLARMSVFYLCYCFSITITQELEVPHSILRPATYFRFPFR